MNTEIGPTGRARKITRRSAKGKGRSFQKAIALRIQTNYGLADSDVRSTAASVTGEDIIFSEEARAVFPYSVECKNQEHLNIWKAIEQSRKNAGKFTPIVIFKKNKEQTYVTIDIDSFFKILNANKTE